MLRANLAIFALIAGVVLLVVPPAVMAVGQPPKPVIHCKVAHRDTGAHDYFHVETVWHLTFQMAFCFDGKRVMAAGPNGLNSEPDGSCDISHTDPITVDAGACDISGFYYAWNGNASGGYQAQATIHIDNSIFHIGRWGTVTVTIKLIMNGNGSWRSEVEH